MAVAFNSGSSRTASTGNITVPAGANRIFVCSISLEYVTSAPSYAPTLGGQALTELTGSPATAGSGPGNNIHTFYLLDANFPATGARDLAVNQSGGSGVQGLLVGWAFLEGTAQSAPTYSETNSVAGGTTVSIGSFSVSTDGAAVAAVTESGSGSFTESANWTEVWDASGAAGDSHGAGAYRLYTSGGTDTVVFTNSVTIGRAAGSAVFIAAAGGGGSSVPKIMQQH